MVILVFMLLNEQIQIALICNVKSLNKMITAAVIKPVLEAPLPCKFCMFPLSNIYVDDVHRKKEERQYFRTDSVFGKGR